jgi:hypothetical protein
VNAYVADGRSNGNEYEDLAGNLNVVKVHNKVYRNHEHDILLIPISHKSNNVCWRGIIIGTTETKNTCSPPLHSQMDRV